MSARMAAFGVLGILIVGPASIGLATVLHWPTVAAALIGSVSGQIGGYAVACRIEHRALW